MTSISFTTPTDQTEISGTERAWAAQLIDNLTTGIVTPRWGTDADTMAELIPRGHYLRNMDRTEPGWLPRWTASFDTAWRTGLELDWHGHKIRCQTVSLNTALLIGNPAIKLIARIHGQSEIHGWIEGPNRAWVASIIDSGRDSGLYRADVGWEKLAAMLRMRADEPAVMSYSVCDMFPSPEASDWLDGLDDEARDNRIEDWYDQSDLEQWERGIDWLRASSDGLEIRPDDWDNFRFGPGLTALDLAAGDRDKRLEKALSGV